MPIWPTILIGQAAAGANLTARPHGRTNIH